MTPALAELLHHHRRTVAELRQQLEVLQGGAFRTREGDRDTTADSIARTEEQIARLKAVIAKHDPDGLTELV
jgi:hypothetical protein